MTGQHWTNRDIDAFAYVVASNFVAQLETKLDLEKMDNKELARRAGVTPSYISQVLNNPGNLGVVTMAKLSRALNGKFAIVFYEDDDSANDHGPIGAEVFNKSWKKAGRPRDLGAFDTGHQSFKQDVSFYRPANQQIQKAVKHISMVPIPPKYARSTSTDYKKGREQDAA